MNPIVKSAWIEALRSGEYSQGRRALHISTGERNTEEFCCLGVLCDLAYQAGVVSRYFNPEAFHYSYGFGPSSNSAELPEQVMRWAGLENADPIVESPLWTTTPGETLAYLNDSGLSFAVIANIIEDQL